MNSAVIRCRNVLFKNKFTQPIIKYRIVAIFANYMIG